MSDSSKWKKLSSVFVTALFVLMFVNCSSGKFSSALNQSAQSINSVLSSNDQTSVRVPVVPTPNPTPSPDVVTVPTPSPTPSPDVNPSPQPQPTPTPSPSAQGSENYKALTGYSAPGSTADAITNFLTFKNFKQIYNPQRMSAEGRLVDDPDRPGKKVYWLYSRTPDTRDAASVLVPKTKIYLPKGTHSLSVSIFAYYSPTVEQAVTFRFGQLPVLTYDEVSMPSNIFSDSHNILRNLFAGAEWSMRTSAGLNAIGSPTAGGAIQGTNQNFYKTTAGGWLYINILKAAGDRVMNIDTQIGVEQSDYESWYNSATWDADGNPI
jgi:hypothetical protein